MGETPRSRAVEKLARLSREGRDLVSFWQEANDALVATLPHYWAPCWYTLDPASLLMTSHVHDGMPEFPEEWLRAEYLVDDVNQLASVAVSATGISTLHEATRGDPASSPRWHANMELGGDQELIARLRTHDGEVWGALGLYRAPGAPMFDSADQAYVRALSPHLAEGARRALLLGEATEPDLPDAPGLIVLDADLRLRSSTSAAEGWLSGLPDGEGRQRLPAAVLAVAARALRSSEGGLAPAEPATARVVSRTGSWLVLHGSALPVGDDAGVAVIVGPAHPASILPLLMSAYGLTEREREVTRLVLGGADTARIAQALSLSRYTVQQHLKSVFDKAGVRSRRDLVARVFFTHYEPRVRDNERRTGAGRPVRGGPAPAPV